MAAVRPVPAKAGSRESTKPDKEKPHWPGTRAALVAKSVSDTHFVLRVLGL